MNIANKFTTLRLFLIPVFVIAYIVYGTTNLLPAILFGAAAFTDFLDGYLARSRNLITTFGKFLDPLADKLLTQAAFIMLVSNHLIPAWTVVVIVCRELFITGFRTIAASNGVTIAASVWGKYKTVLQFVTILLFLLREVLFPQLGFPIAEIALYLAVFFTVLSGVDYIYKNRTVLDLSNI